MSQVEERRDASSSRRRSETEASQPAPRRGGRRSKPRGEQGDESSSEDKASPGSWNVDRGRSRTRRPSNTVTEDSLRRRGYHALVSSFGKVFHVEKRWKMIRDMGSGAYGVVISAADEISGETVAIKLVTRVFEKVSLAKRALREITLLRHFANHENITGLIDVDAISKDFNEIYLFMEPMEADLHQIIKSGQSLTNEHVQYFVYQILRGMKYVHSASVVHRDLKPGNLLVNADCELKICDFGLSRGFDAAPEEYATQMTEYVATRWYRAPEIMLAFRRYNTAIDVWSIGCILAELLLGRPLFKGKDYVDQLNKILDVLGSPDESIVKRIGSDKAQAYVRSLPYRKTVPFRKLMPSADPLALDLLAKMLAFDPQDRITVPQALEHPWLASYHDVTDEPECSVPYEKWRDIEKLETIDQYREALWNEIEEYRHEVRNTNFEMEWPKMMTANSVERPHVEQQERTSTPPGIVVEDESIEEAETSTAVEAGGANKSDYAKEDEKQGTESDTVTVGAPVVEDSAPISTIPLPGLERRDSMRPPTPADMANDPVVTYARRSSILQAQYLQQLQKQGNSVSPVRRTQPGMPVYAEESNLPTGIANFYSSQRREGAPFPVPTPPPIVRAPSAGPSATGSIPFPSTGGGSFIVPARSRTASTVGGESMYGTRKILRTLSTVSIHESMDSVGGLAAMGPIGQAIMERRETAADAPPSEMPREFDTVREEEGEYRSFGTASGSTSASVEGISARPVGQEGRSADNTSGTPSKKKEKRFLIF